MLKPFPMPVHIVIDHPAVWILPNAAWHIVLALSLTYWRSECRDLPPAGSDLIAIARTDAATWNRHRANITAAISMILPLLKSFYVEQSRIKLSRSASARHAAIARHRAARRHDASLPAITTEPAPPPAPLPMLAKAPLFAPTGKTDRAARMAVATRNARYADGGHRLLSDSPGTIPKPTRPDAMGEWTWEPSEATRAATTR